MKIIDRYILREVTIPFFLSLFVMTFVLLLGKILQLMDLMVNKGVRIFDIIKLLAFLMPSFLVYTVPISLLMAVLSGMGRMAKDNEITILKSAGVSLYRIFQPIAGISVVAFVITLALSLFFVPDSNQATKNLLFTVIRYNATVGIKEKVFNDNFKGILLYANSIPADGNFMEGVVISDSRIIDEPNTIFAEKAYLISDPESMRVSLRLERGSIHTLDFKRKYYRKMDFSAYDINLDMEAAIAETGKGKIKDSTEMTVGELRNHIKNLKREDESRRELTVELNKKFTFPLTCLIFGLLGMPIGVTVRKTARARAVGIGVIITLLYYLLQLFGAGLIETGKISPVIGAWFPTVLFAAAGIYLLVTTAEEKTPAFLNGRLWLKNLTRRRKG